MAYEFRHRMRVEFVDTDMAGMVHFSQFFRYMAATEHAFLRSLGLSGYMEVDGRVVSWPRGGAECKYKAPLRFEDEFEVHLLVREMRRSSVIYDFRFYKEEAKAVAKGSLTVVCAVRDGTTGEMSAISIPDWFRECVEVAPAEVRQT